MTATWRMTVNKSSILVLCLALLGLAACTPGTKTNEDVRPEIQKLKTDIKALQDKVGQLEGVNKTLHEKTARLDAANQEILKLLLKPESVSLTPAPPATGPALTLGQLLQGKERYQETRVKVKALPGTVTVHHKTFIFKAPEGVVEVYFGAIPDTNTVNRLSSTPLDKPLTVTGVFHLPSKKGGNHRITAEAVEF